MSSHQRVLRVIAIPLKIILLLRYKTKILRFLHRKAFTRRKDQLSPHQCFLPNVLLLGPRDGCLQVQESVHTGGWRCSQEPIILTLHLLPNFTVWSQGQVRGNMAIHLHRVDGAQQGGIWLSLYNG